ncbi:MAG: T9SS type A sorting domain-containing protein, partial [Ignavibacteriaceae bacterium]|nr:T9SS type A sorting domain-containing protein [Ignavibacteriaceae bacterium]
VGVDDNIGNINTFELLQNYPNPFNPSTRIQYSIAEPGLVSVKVFDVLGRQIADLVNSQQSAGTYTVDFNAQNLSAGVYLYKIESGSFQATKKMILLK